MIHSTAIISPKAKLGNDVDVGPFSVIGANVTIGSAVKIASSCLIDGNTAIGEGTKIFSGVVIGSVPQDLKYKGEETKVVIGKNNIIREYTTVNLGTAEKGTTEVGDDNLIMAYSHIAHDCKVGSGCVLANCATLAGHVTIEDRAVIGGLVAIHQFTRVGRLSIVGGCSKVVQDIPPFSTCDGHPTAVFGLNLIGLRRAKVSKESIANLKSAFKYLFFGGLNVSHAIEEIKKSVPDDSQVAYLLDFMKSSSRGVSKGTRGVAFGPE